VMLFGDILGKALDFDKLYRVIGLKK
jgi:hypothetical protein